MNTDRFTALTVYIGAWHEFKRDLIYAKKDIYSHKHSIMLWKKNQPSECVDSLRKYRSELKESRRFVFLLTKYIDSLKEGKPLKLKEDKELFKLYIKHSFYSPESINKERSKERAILEYISDIRSYVENNRDIFDEERLYMAREYKIKTDNCLEYFEHLCIKCLERPNVLTAEDDLVHASLWTAIIWKTKEIPELREYYLKYRKTIEVLREPKVPSTDSDNFFVYGLNSSYELDIRTDKFTELAEVFYGFIDIANDIEYLQTMKPTDTPHHEYEKARLIDLLNKYSKGHETPLNDEEDKELFILYTRHINKRSPEAINKERDRIRAILVLESRMQSYNHFKINWDIPGEEWIASGCMSNLGYLCRCLLNEPKKVTYHSYKKYKVLFNLAANLAPTIPEYNEWWQEYLKIEGVHRVFELQHDTIDDIIARSHENDLNTDRFTILSRYFYDYHPLSQLPKYMRYLMELDLKLIQYYNKHPEMQSGNTEYISSIFSMIRQKRRFISLLYLFINSKEKGKPISDYTDKELYRLYMLYSKHFDFKTIDEDRDTYRAKLRLISDMKNAIATDELTWRSKYEKDRLDHYLNYFMMICITYLYYPTEADDSYYYYRDKQTEFIVNTARTNAGLRKCWKKYMNTLNHIHNRYHVKKDKRITMSSEHDVKTDRFTELTEYFYGFDNQEDTLQYFRDMLANDEKEMEYYTENPDKMSPKTNIFDIEDTIKYRKPMVTLMAKYVKGKRLTLEEDRKLYQLYIEHRAIASPMEINRQRERNRSLLSFISKIKNNPKYAAFDLSKLERLCVKLLERPKEVTSSDYSEFAELRNSVLSQHRGQVLQ
ncbi:MAG: hypothetical protein L7F77_08435 [Candidatus Magnetominusculus sp. LBB02]|nr:hypothetical protein [Candidatus Magnetominusculus sp. LBB02]